jgi:microcystin-dependent protein
MPTHVTQVIDQGVYLPRGPILGTDAVNLAYLTNYVNSLSANYFVPVGMVAFFATTYSNAAPTAPAGWLKANGALISTATYGNLYSALRLQNSIQTPWTQAGDTPGYFRIPDLRGVFVRGWNDGLTNVAAGNPDTNPPSGITNISTHDNTSRVFGAYQADSFDSHTHIATVTEGTGHNHLVGSAQTYLNPDVNIDVNGQVRTGVKDYNTTMPRGGYHPGGDTSWVTSSTTTGVSVTNASTGGTENRPYNVALLACIKY